MSDRYLARNQAASGTSSTIQVGIVLLMLILFTGCGAGGNQNTRTPTNWVIATHNFVTGDQHNYYLNEYPWSAGVGSDGSLWFTLPNYSSANEASRGENVTRLWELFFDQQRSLDRVQNINLSFSMSAQEGTTLFWKTETVNTCNTPAEARPMFVAWYKGQLQATDEWWADDNFVLAPESKTLQVPLTPEHWTDLYAEHANASASVLNGFNFARSNVQAYGMSFGGGCFYGHGVSTIGGSARFEVHVQPDLANKQ
jgi:hypothetical protein